MLLGSLRAHPLLPLLGSLTLGFPCSEEPASHAQQSRGCQPRHLILRGKEVLQGREAYPCILS